MGCCDWQLVPVPCGSLEWEEAVLKESRKDVVQVKHQVNVYYMWSHLHMMMQFGVGWWERLSDFTRF